MSRFDIRLMTGADVDIVRHLDQLAFGEWARRRGRGEPMPRRTRANILSNRARDPEGCFVAEVQGCSAGYVFSRTWGRVGWFGTLGVHPRFQGQGIGRALVGASVAYLDRRGCTTIGLGTMPEEPANVGLYARSGFRPDYTTVVLAQPAARAKWLPAHALWSELAPQAQERLLDGPLSRICDEVRPGMDFAPEVCAATADGYGDTLLLGGPTDPCGFVVVRTRSKWEGKVQTTLNVEAGALAEGEEGRLGEVLSLLADFASRQGLAQVLLPVNSFYWPAMKQLLALGCRAVHTRLRMVARQEPARPTAIALSTWAA
jgi:ribosomal protein S18 acetylase RimI-like enzyme